MKEDNNEGFFLCLVINIGKQKTIKLSDYLLTANKFLYF
jgi:hypothetical protein